MKNIKDNLLLFLKGFIMGIANIIPGVSGGTLAVILGVFKKFVESISNIFKKFKELKLKKNDLLLRTIYKKQLRIAKSNSFLFTI